LDHEKKMQDTAFGCGEIFVVTKNQKRGGKGRNEHKARGAA